MPRLAPADSATTSPPVAHEFYFTRGNYGGEVADWGPRWAIDFPKADQQFLVALTRLSVVDAFPAEHALEIQLDNLRDFPFLYMLEVGSLDMDERMAEQLRAICSLVVFWLSMIFGGAGSGTTLMPRCGLYFRTGKLSTCLSIIPFLTRSTT